MNRNQCTRQVVGSSIIHSNGSTREGYRSAVADNRQIAAGASRLKDINRSACLIEIHRRHREIWVEGGCAGLRQIDLTGRSRLQGHIAVEGRTFDEDAATGEDNLVTGAERLDGRGSRTVGLEDYVRRGATREIQGARGGEERAGFSNRAGVKATGVDRSRLRNDDTGRIQQVNVTVGIDRASDGGGSTRHIVQHRSGEGREQVVDRFVLTNAKGLPRKDRFVRSRDIQRNRRELRTRAA